MPNKEENTFSFIITIIRENDSDIADKINTL